MTSHISYSQYSSYVKCPRNWYLSKIVQAEEKQTWYIPIGSAVHSMIEAHLKGEPTDVASHFYPLISKQMLIEPDTSKWMAGGSKDNPIIEERALKRVQECFDKALTFLEDIEVWEVEYNASGRLPGLDPEVKAYVDILGEHKKKGPIIVDWKTGSTKPDNFQLETYAALLEYNLSDPGCDRVPYQGWYAMLAPGASNARAIDLTDISPLEVGTKYQQVWEKMQAKRYQTNAGFNCKFCFNQDNCLVNAGPTDRAKYYDRSYRDGIPF